MRIWTGQLSAATLMGLALAGVLLSNGCTDDEPKKVDDDTDSGTEAEAGADGGAPAKDGGAVGDAAMPEADGATQADADTSEGGQSVPTGCAAGCTGATPVCFADSCVQCDADHVELCGSSELCDTRSHRCVDKAAPFALDCGSLPANGVCQGGPREVLLAMHERGLIAMLDPTDGHFLGWFKRSTNRGEHFLATQGPDQCIWTAVEDDGYDDQGEPSTRAIERWNTDGTFRDAVIRKDSKVVQDTDGMYRDVVDSPHSIAFTHDKVYVASTSGTPEARIARFDLTGKFEEVVLDDGSVAESILVRNDGSLIISNNAVGGPYAVELLPADNGPRVTILGDVATSQLAYAGDGKLLVAGTSSGEKSFLVDIATQMADGIYPYTDSGTNLRGIAPLKNGQWLITAGAWGVATLDPSSDPKGKVKSVVDEDPSTEKTVDTDPAIPDMFNFNYIGRACLSEAFVASKAADADPPLASCDAPDGSVIFAADFEEGNLDGFSDLTHAAVTLSVDPASPAAGSGSLKIQGGTGDWLHDPSGAYHTFAAPAPRPTYIEYSVKIANATTTGGYVSLNESLNTGYLDAVLIANGAVTTFESDVYRTITPNTWARIQLRDIDWDDRTFDLYVDCERVGNDIAFSPFGGKTLDRLELFNYSANAVAWFDNIVVK